MLIMRIVLATVYLEAEVTKLNLDRDAEAILNFKFSQNGEVWLRF